MNFGKVSDIPYEHLILDPIPAELLTLQQEIEKASSAQELIASYKRLEAFKDKLSTMQNLCRYRHTNDTHDSYYDAETDYFNDHMPKIEELFVRIDRSLLDSSFREDLVKELGELAVRNMQLTQRTISPDIMKELAEENALKSRYEKLMAAARIPFRGKMLTLPQIEYYEESIDRAEREEAYRAHGGHMASIGGELDEIYDQMVKVRTRMANKLGFDTYTDMSYYTRTRNCYGRQELDRFRKYIIDSFVPYNNELFKRQAERTGISKPMIWDREYLFPEGTPKPIGTPEQIFENGKKMYRELSPEAGEFFDFMLEHGTMDVLSRDGKANGGYCSSLRLYNSPIIFANFNGTSGDTQVLTHECGHAFEGYVAGRIPELQYGVQRHYTSDLAEIHSMGMEMFCYPWMDLFYKNTNKFYYSHLFHYMKFMPYGSMVDHFQHIVYENVDMTPSERHAKWLELEKIYRPDIDYGDIPHFSKGGIWQYKQHLYQYPFYYIEYVLAQYVAFHIWAANLEDHDDAWSRYMDIIRKAGTRDYLRVVQEAGFPSPFDEGATAQIADKLYHYLSHLESKF